MDGAGFKIRRIFFGAERILNPRVVLKKPRTVGAVVKRPLETLGRAAHSGENPKIARKPESGWVRVIFRARKSELSESFRIISFEFLLQFFFYFT